MNQRQNAMSPFLWQPRTYEAAMSRLMRAKPNLELRKRGSISWARKYNDCRAFASIYEGGSRSNPRSRAMTERSFVSDSEFVVNYL